jgi:YesN/AraC family two-component response regulator
VLSGDEAIAAMEQQQFDLVVSDVRMPGMDGGQLLTVVKQRWPDVMRIIVSGYSDPVQAVRLTSLAHQYVAKPCDGRELENIIERCFHLKDLLGQEASRPLRSAISSTRTPQSPARCCRLRIPRFFVCASRWCESRMR